LWHRSHVNSPIKQNVPADATIAQDKRVNLPNRGDSRHLDSPYFLDQKVVSNLFAVTAGSIEELRMRGINYVAVSEAEYGRFFLKTHKPTEGLRPDYDRGREFYGQLFREGKLLWECKAGLLPYLQPQIRLYYLPSGNRGDRGGPA
jgi:hypothetical protein